MPPVPNPAILQRFSPTREGWPSLVNRVASIGAVRDQAEYRDIIGGGFLVPGGQILRGAGRPDAVLYNCFVTGAGAEEDPAALAARVTNWTRLGAGVGVNLDKIAARERNRGGSACAVIEFIALSHPGYGLRERPGPQPW